ncbi:MAG: penicillin-binding transpeptidase domain-containing protein [Verrucomicrobiales bacterium]|nr:penicillin-binding transpeptidase domain-containing protein [Verrucomicrobiales bacterium]
MQINQHEHYSKLVPGNKFETIRVPGIRGEIKDRHGVTLVDSTPNYELRFNLREIVEAYKEKHGTVPRSTYYAKDGDGITRPRGQDDIVKIVKETVFDGLRDLDLLADFSASAMEVHYRSNGGLVPFTFRRDLTFHDFARFAERNIGLPGVTVTRTGRRRYLYDSLACHVLGYMSLADLDKVDAEKKKEYTYYVGDDYGVHGIEKTMDSYLQGKPGIIKIEKNEKRKFLGVVERSEPTSGSDVYLTIDARLQYVTAQSLREIGRGAAVAIDPNTGDILSIASVPSYNPNNLIPGNVSAEDWKRYTMDNTAPLFSRALNPYAPGSTCKIPIALAGCLSDSWKINFSCGGGKQFGNKFMKCWKSSGHGSVDLSNSIKRSCNGFYYRYANHTGIDNIAKMTNMLGMGKLTGIRVTGEKPGNVPNPEKLRQKGLDWSPVFTALTSIGQGTTEATPIQMASVTATVANGGKVYQPRLVKRVLDRDGLLELDEKPKIKYDLTKEGVTAAQIELVKRGMWRVVNESGGTAGRAKSSITTISGKTGTAQTGNLREPTNAWFIAFAPYDEPEIAVCVFVQNGKSGGGAASPIAKNIIEHFFAMKKGTSKVKLTKLPEAIGNKRFVESTSFDNSELVAAFNKPVEEPTIASDEEEETTVDVGDFVVPKELTERSSDAASENYVKPTIRKEVDSRGTVKILNNSNSSSRWNSSSRRRISN